MPFARGGVGDPGGIARGRRRRGSPPESWPSPASSPLHLSTYALTLVGKYLCYAMLALAVDLIWGYCGILSLGHAAFFSLGGYAMGMYLMRQIGPRGVYGNPLLPDFMVFLNWKFCHGSGSASIISGLRWR